MSGKNVLWYTVVINILLFIFLAFLTRPIPFSDFQYYWDLSINYNLYVKGGLLPLLYFPLRSINLPAFISSLIVNSICYLIISRIIINNVFSKLTFYFAQFFLITLGIWFSGLAPIVNSDIPHVMLVILFFNSLLSNKLTLDSLLTLFVATSMRLQSALIVSFMSLYGFVREDLIKGVNREKLLIVTIVIAIAVLAEVSLSLLNPNKIDKKLASRIPLYSGIIHTKNGVGCGMWTSESVLLAENQLDMSIKTVILDNFKKNWRNIPRIIICKYSSMLSYNQLTSQWLIGNYERDHPSNRIPRTVVLLDSLKNLEIALTSIVKIFVLTWIIFQIIKNNNKYILPLVILISYFLAHTLIEIQPRYVLPMYTTLLFIIYKSVCKSNKNNVVH